MNSYLVRAAVFAACLVSPVFAVDQSDGKTEFLISGPLEKVDAALDTVTVFGRDFVTDKASELAVGEIVNVYGSLQKDGSIANPVVEPTAQFGSGADPVFIKGLVTDVNGALGQMQVGGTTVDYTQQLASSEFAAPSIGQVIAVEGTQPLVKGVLLASDMGSNLIARASVPRSNLSTLSTQGSGRAAMSTQGSGRAAMSTQGSGRAAMSTQGSGRAAMSTQGSGRAAMSTQGSGRAAMSTQGSGRAAMSTQGSGRAAMSTQGSGLAAMSTQGSGVHAR
jgi:Domain of unknown function (DUF5666)